MIKRKRYTVLRRHGSWEHGEAVESGRTTFTVRGVLQPFVDRTATPAEEGARTAREWVLYLKAKEPELVDADSANRLPDLVMVNGEWVELRAAGD